MIVIRRCWALEALRIGDDELVRALARGEWSALALLYDRYAHLAYSLAMRMVGDPDRAREIVRDVFVAIWKRRETLDSERESGAPWLLEQVRQMGIAQQRNGRGTLRPERAGALPVEEEEPHVLLDLGQEPEREFWGAARRSIRAALSALPAEERRAIELSYFHGYTQDELARLTGEPLTAVRERLLRGLQALHATLRSDSATGWRR